MTRGLIAAYALREIERVGGEQKRPRRLALLVGSLTVLPALLAVAGEARAAFGDPAFRECLTGNSSIAACTPIPGATPGGLRSGLAVPLDVAVSADGASVYAISAGATRDHAVARFDRDPTTGQLTRMRQRQAGRLRGTDPRRNLERR